MIQWRILTDCGVQLGLFLVDILYVQQRLSNRDFLRDIQTLSMTVITRDYQTIL